MLTPSSGTLADYNDAILNGNPTHVRVIFPVQNKTFTDADIAADGGITITHALNPDTDLIMGKAVSSEIVIRFLNNGQFSGFDWTEEFHIDFGVEISGTTVWKTVGYFTGKRPQRIKRAEIIEFTAYDRMQKFDKLADDFIDGLTFPLTLTQIYTALRTYVGVSSVSGDGISSAMAVTYSTNPIPKGVSCRQILAWIAEVNCCYAKITSGGSVRVSWFSDQTSVYSLTGDDYFGIDIDEATAPLIDSVYITSSDPNATGYIYPVSGYHETYTILDNPFLLNMPATQRTTVQTTIISRFAAIGAYAPVAVNAVGNWMVEAGDIIEITYDGNQTVNLPIFHRVLHWDGGCIDVYECTGATERTDISELQRDEYETGAKLSNKYTIQSGVDITSEGITVSGGKYVKIVSGGVVDIQSTNFVIDSTNKVIKIGDYDLTVRGLVYTFDHRPSGSGTTYTMGLNMGSNYKPSDVGAITYIQSGNIDSGTVSLPKIIFGIRGNNPLRSQDFDNSISIGKGKKSIGGSSTPSAAFDNLIILPDENVDTCIGSSSLPFYEVIAKYFFGDGVKNDLTETNAGYVLDARQGKILKDLYDAIDYYNFLKKSDTTIPSNSVLSNYNTPGVYTIQNATVAATISDCPYTSSGGRLEVIGQNSDSSYLRQMYYPSGSVNIYTRVKSSSTWGDWYRLNMTQV